MKEDVINTPSDRSPISEPAPAARAGQSLKDLLELLEHAGYGGAMIHDVLGETGVTAAATGAPQAAEWHVQRSTATDHARQLVRTFYLRRPISMAALDQCVGTKLIEKLIADHVFVPHGADTWISNVDIRPITVASHGVEDVLIASDPDASLWDHVPGPDHVPGVGNAPISLLGSIPPIADGSRVLDLGCGSGVLSLVLASSATDVTVVGTDISLRALAYAQANGQRLASKTKSTVTWKHGDWFAPVAEEKFDYLVANPPFVVGPPDVEHVYRDSGLPLDGATQHVVESAPGFLTDSGTAHILAAWALRNAETAAQRVVSWLPEKGIRAWVLQRETVDPATYVTTWLEDESIDPRHEAGRARTQRWMDYFAEHDVVEVGLGFIHLQRIEDDAPTELTVEPLDHALSPGTFLGAEVGEFFARSEWLAGISGRGPEAILDAHFALRPTVALERVSLPGSDATTSLGFLPEVSRLTRTDGPRWSHEVDEPLITVLAGVHPRALPLRDVAELYCAVNDVDDMEFCAALAPLAVDLVRHGMLIPAELWDESEEENHYSKEGV